MKLEVAGQTFEMADEPVAAGCVFAILAIGVCTAICFRCVYGWN